MNVSGYSPSVERASSRNAGGKENEKKARERATPRDWSVPAKFCLPKLDIPNRCGVYVRHDEVCVFSFRIKETELSSIAIYGATSGLYHDTKLARRDCGFRSINSFGRKAGSQRTFRVSFSFIATVFSFFHDALRYFGRPKDDTEISRSLLDRGRNVLVVTITFNSDSTYLEKYP